MKLKFRIDHTNTKHTRVTVFQDGGNCGTLTMETYAMFILLNKLSTIDDENIKIEMVKNETLTKE